MMKIRVSFISAVISLFSIIGFGTWMFHLLEDWTWAESFYFSVATLTTVGYGDIHPTTDGSRIATALFILLGVGIVIAALTRIGSKYLSTQEHRLSENIAHRLGRHDNDKNDEKTKK
jgi:voltage-gated potassium channel